MIQEALNILKDIGIDVLYFIVNAIITALGALVSLAAAILPTWNVGSISLEGSPMAQVVSAINWVLPVGVFLDCLGLYGLSVASYFTAGIVTRWAKISG